MPESPTAWGAIPVEDTKPPAKDSPQAWGAIPLTKTTNAGADAAEEKQLADNIASYQKEKKQRDSAKGIARYFLPPATGMAPGVGSPGRQEPIQVPRVSTDEVASAFGISPDHAANLAGFMNSVSSPFVEFPFTPQGAGVAGASAIPGVAPLVGAGFTIKAFIDNPEMAREAGAGWVEAHNPQSTPEQKQVGWEKFWGAVGNIGIGGMGAMPGAHLAETKLVPKSVKLAREINQLANDATLTLPEAGTELAKFEKGEQVIPPEVAQTMERARAREAATEEAQSQDIQAQQARQAQAKASKMIQVPETSAESERQYSSVVDEVRQRGLDTKRKVQAVFPQLNREEAGNLVNLAFPKEKGQPNAQAIRSDQGPAQEPGVQPKVGKTDSGGNLQQAPPGTPDATAQAQVKLTPEEQAKVSSELDQELGQEPTSQPPPQTKTSTPVTEPVKTKQRTAAESSLAPAIQTPDGQTFTGDDHVAAYEKAKKTVPDTSGSQEGFIDEKTGEFLTREQAAAKTGLPTKTEEGKLHSTDLPDTTKPISAGKEGETKTAQAAANKVEDHVQDVAKTEGKRPAKEVKSELIRRLEQSIKDAPNEVDVQSSSYTKVGGETVVTPDKAEMVTIDIPGDGTFKIRNTKEALTGILKRAKAIEVAPTGKAPIKTRGIPKAITEETKAEIAGQGKAKGISEGPGAASPGDVPSVQLDQLAQSFKGASAKRTLSDVFKESYDLGKIKSAAVDTVSRAVSGLKATGDLAKRLWENIGDLDEFKKILGKYSREVNVKDYSLRQFAGEVARTMPKIADQEAIASWVDAGGDMATLKRGALETTDRYRKSYEDAQKLTPEQLVVAKNIQNYFEARLKEAMDAGILDSGIEDYIHRIYEKGPLKDRVLNAIQSGVLDTRDPSLARKRLFEFDFEAEKAGLPIIKAFLPRILDYEASLAHAIASRAAVKRFTELKEADGNPMIAVAGLGRVVEDQAGVKPPSVIVNPHVLNEKQRGLYEHRDYPALQKWKWVAKDTDGKNVFVQGDVLIHKDSVGRIDKFLKPSAIRQNPVGRAALAASSAVKQTMLDLSGFHQVQLTVHALEHRVLPNRILEKIDLNNPDVQKLLEGGVTLGGKYRGGIADEGLWGKSLTRMIPGLGKLSESYHEYLFNDYIPRLKMTMAMDALERNRAKYGKKLSEEKLAYLTANEANAAFGELNYTMMERSKTWQDAARLILLAPDFLEARGKFVGQALTKYGSEQRMALLLGATTMYVTARIFNKLVDGQYHFEKENLFNLVYKNHAYSLRTVQGDVLHLMDKPISFWMNRLNPVYGRTALEMASGRDQFGRKRDFFDQVKDAVNTAVPISLRHNREQSILDSILISLGVTARKYSDVGNAYKLANDWRKKAGVKERPEVIYDPDKDDLYGLKVDLWNDDQAGAIKEIKRLIESGKSTPRKLKDHFNAYASSPFTGSRANDAKFLASLGKDDKITVESAKTHKRLVREQFNKALEIYVSLKAQEPPKETKP